VGSYAMIRCFDTITARYLSSFYQV
jgi:hypothetical protein